MVQANGKWELKTVNISSENKVYWESRWDPNWFKMVLVFFIRTFFIKIIDLILYDAMIVISRYISQSKLTMGNFCGIYIFYKNFFVRITGLTPISPIHPYLSFMCIYKN